MMSTYAGPFSGKDKGALTRTDVEERIRRVGKSEHVDLTGEDLSGADLSNMELTGIIFRRADLRGADLRGADLSGVDLIDADLRGADLSDADLSRADLIEANLIEANLIRANLIRANLSGAILGRADLSGADLSRADLVEARLIEANLSEANLSEANLIRANLSGANLIRAILGRADLSRADLSRANLIRANLIEARLIEADLSGANLSGANLSRANLGGANVNNVIGFPKPQLIDLVTTPGLHLRIIEEPLTLQHLADTLDSLIILYVKLWLLEQQRFDDFVRYSAERDRSLEAEVPLPIAEMTYNSPWRGKFNLDLSPKGVVEALQALVEMIAHFQIRKDVAKANLLSNQLDNQLKQEELKQARLTTIEHAFGTLEQGSMLLDKLSPGLNEEQKAFALQSLAKEVLHLASDATLEITLIPPPSAEKQKAAEPPPAVSTQVTETLAGTSPAHAEGKIL
jgi:uncharacterized protein YjbI with pentapeptide repeats